MNGSRHSAGMRTLRSRRIYMALAILRDIVKEDARAGEVINRLRALLKKAKTDRESLLPV
jgi:hypothetical protein